MENGTKQKTAYPLIAVLSVLLGYLIYRFAEVELTDVLSDYSGHLYVYLPKFSLATLKEGWETVPYFLWHGTVLLLNRVLMIPLEQAAIFTSALYAIAAYLVVTFLLNRYEQRMNGERHGERNALLAFGLMVVQGIYLNWVGVYGNFLGIYSPNPYHNPPQMCVTVFSLICLALVTDIIEKMGNADYAGCFFPVEKGLKKYYLLLTCVLFLSVLAKPTFAEMFIPAVGLYMLIKRPGKSVANIWHLFLCAVPALLYIALQYIDYFLLGGRFNSSGEVILTKAGEVWSLYSDNLLLSVLLGMAFPITILLMDVRYFVTQPMGILGVLCYTVGLLEACFLGESGERFFHGNFIWPMMSGMLMLWVVSLLRLLALEKQAETKGQKACIFFAWFLFGLHVLMGILMLYHM
ncbi:MAG: hypothetical protein K6A92_11030 [Lachnospiraceae bacterium]|nr:hypothetical protein [Lachnospiraceae bacterium]